MPAVDSNASRSRGSGRVLRGEIESLCNDFALRLSAEVGRAAVSTLARSEEMPVAETPRTLEEVAAAVCKIPCADRAAAVPKVTATGARRDISSRLSAEMDYGEEDDVRVVPMLLRNTVIGVLLADGPPIQESAIETLVLASEAWIEALGSRPGSQAGRATDLG